MTPIRQRTLRETHPELLFWRLNNNAPMPNKKSEHGRNQRVDILKTQGFEQLDRWLLQRTGTGIGRDDVIDACACAIVARHSFGKLPSEETPLDAKGLRMEMWF
jgi:predicted RNase H-like nuclease